MLPLKVADENMPLILLPPPSPLNYNERNYFKAQTYKMVKIGKETRAKYLVRGDEGRDGNDFICPDKASTKLAMERAES